MELQNINTNYAYEGIYVNINGRSKDGFLDVYATKELSPGFTAQLSIAYDKDNRCVTEGVVPAAPFDADFFAALEAEIAGINALRNPTPNEEV